MRTSKLSLVLRLAFDLPSRTNKLRFVPYIPSAAIKQAIFRATAKAFMVMVIAYWLCRDHSSGASATPHGALTAI
jgi:hypothetical protein